VDDEIAVIDQNPLSAIVSLHAHRPPTGFFQLLTNFVADSLSLPLVGTGTNQEEIGEGCDFAEIKDFEVDGLFGLGCSSRNQPVGKFLSDCRRMRDG
jgi:hypothetical protein